MQAEVLCPYCGSNDIDEDGHDDLLCMTCGMTFGPNLEDIDEFEDGRGS